MRRRDFDGGMVIATVIAALTVILTLVGLARIQPASDMVGPRTSAPLTRLEIPVTRATTSTMMPPPPAQVTVTTTPPATVGPGEVFYPDCPTARATGVTELRRGQPGYRAQLDRDNDGVACESPPVPPTAPTTPPMSPRPRLTPGAPVPAPKPMVTARPPAAPPTAPPPPFVVVPPSVFSTTGPATTLALPDPPTTAQPTTTTTTEPPTTEPTTTTAPPPRFTDCNQVVAAGLDVPLTPASPWWNPALDVDGDGLACEDDAPDPIPTTTTTVTPLVDCVAAWDLGLAPLHPDSPYWNAAWDPDGRGVACATDPRTVTVVSSTSSSTETTTDAGR